MGFLNKIFKPFKNTANLNNSGVQIDDVLLQALLNGEAITREKALTLPAVSSAVDFISNCVACMPIKLYRYKKGKIEEIENDNRTKLLNGDTGDTLDGFQMKKAIVTDYLLGKGGYAYIEWSGNDITAIRYVKDINVTPYTNADPIFKFVQFTINGQTYPNYKLIKVLRNTKDGASGVGVISEVSKAIETAYNTMIYQLSLVESGGNKKGFVLSERKLGKEEIEALRQAWNRMYANNTQSVVVLNNGLKFQESSNSSVEMQLNESKKTLEDEINSIFHIHEDFNLTFKEAVYPVIKAFETAINSTMLLEKEKKNMFFEFDVKEIIKANLKERYDAYNLALKGGWKSVNEVRKEENMNYVEGMDILNIGLGSALYDINTHTYYIPNTDKQTSLTENTNDNANDNSNDSEGTNDLQNTNDNQDTNLE